MANTNYPSASNPTDSNTPSSAGGGRNLIIGLLIAALLGTWGYMLWDKSSRSGSNSGTPDALQSETAMSEIDSLKQMFILAEMRLDSITGANNNLQGEKTALQKEIDQKKAEISKILTDKNATAADLKKARQLIGELNGQIGRLEAEVTRLKGENQELRARTAHLTNEKEVLTQNLAIRTSENEELANAVDIASTLSASGMSITPVHEKKNGKEKETSFARRVDKLKISFNIENRITTSGPADLYVIVTDPSGKIIQNPELGSGAMTTRQDGDRNFTAKVPVEYETGTRKGVSFPIKSDEGFKPGDYKIEVYHNGFKIGEGIRSLRKGLFG
ncbi:Chromosome partition protein Smc [Mycovorax composti]|jgi:Chromosome segregation ATPases|uniref:Chromosome partition protein Smc n=2 Tax=Chitinophagaceae TaxID=563835 RepID=A0ABZ2EJM3_9BACT